MKRAQIIFRPLENWPRSFTEKDQRKGNPFQSCSLARNLALLRKELGAIQAATVVIQTAHQERDIRASDGPRTDRTPAHPGVIVAGDTQYGALKFLCDDCEKWIDNVRAIALTLERLRLAERYGVTRRGEQYLGWKMLPGPITASDQRGMTVEQAAAFIASFTGGVPSQKLIESRSWFENAYRDAARKLHPDRKGDKADWDKLQDAKTLLDSLHNRK